MEAVLQPVASVPAAIAAVGVLVCMSCAFGRVLVRPIHGIGWKVWDGLLVATAVGLNLVALLGILLGSLSAFPGIQPVWIIFALIGILSVRDYLKNIPRSAFSSRNGLHSQETRKEPAAQRRLRVDTSAWDSWSVSSWGFRLAFLTVGLLWLVMLGPALCPPTGWDELVYHHELPRRWLADGWPAFYPDLPYSGFPSLAEILFWLIAPIENAITPRLLNWVCWMLGLALAYRLLRRVVRPHLAVLILLALATSSSLLMISANCYVEGMQLMNVAAMLLLVNNRRICRRFPVPVAMMLGVLAGGTVAIKLTGLPVLALPVVWLLIPRRPSRLLPFSPIRFLSIYALAALGIAFPFYLRPWLLTGDPFYPYYAQWFSADPARLEMSRYQHALGSAFGVSGLIGLVLGPIFLAFDRELYDGDFGWQFVILLGLAISPFLLNKQSQRARPFLVSAAVLYVFWFLTAQQARFLIPANLLIAAGGASGLRVQNRRWHPLIVLLLLTATLFSVPWRTRGHYLGSWMCAVGLISQSDYVHVSTDREYVPLIAAIHEHTPADAHVMLLFEHRGFYIPRQHRIGTPFFQERGFTPPEQFSDATAVLALLEQERITHLVVTSKPTGPDIPAAWLGRVDPLLAALNHCIEAGALVPVWQSDRHVLYEVRQAMSSTAHF